MLRRFILLHILLLFLLHFLLAKARIRVLLFRRRFLTLRLNLGLWLSFFCLLVLVRLLLRWSTAGLRRAYPLIVTSNIHGVEALLVFRLRAFSWFLTTKLLDFFIYLFLHREELFPHLNR